MRWAVMEVAMAAVVKHLAVHKPAIFGKDCWITTSLCRRLRTMSDGMNLVETEAEVTCKFCLKRIEQHKAKSA